MTNVGQGSHM